MQSSGKRISIASSGLLMLALTAGCKTIPTTGTADVCLIWRPVTYSASQDSAKTINEAREQNARRNAYCEASPR